MQVQTIIYTDSMEASIAWWSTVLGRTPDHTSDMWTTWSVGDAIVAVHGTDAVPAGSRIQVSLVLTGLDDKVEELSAHGLEPAGDVIEQPFGRQVPYRDPSGNLVMLNEHA